MASGTAYLFPGRLLQFRPQLSSERDMANAPCGNAQRSTLSMHSSTLRPCVQHQTYRRHVRPLFQVFRQACPRAVAARSLADDDLRWSEEMQIFRKRTLKPNQLEALAKAKLESDAGQVRQAARAQRRSVGVSVLVLIMCLVLQRGCMRRGIVKYEGSSARQLHAALSMLTRFRSLCQGLQTTYHAPACAG